MFKDMIKDTKKCLVKIAEANDFAMELLMPEYKFVKVFEAKKGNTKEIAEVFGVEENLVLARALNLGLIDNI